MDRKGILNKILGKKSKENLPGLIVPTPYPQLNTKNSLISSYPGMGNDVKKDIYNSSIQDITPTLQSNKDKTSLVGPQNNGGEVAARYMGDNKVVTYGKQKPDVLLHEQLHNQFVKQNPDTTLQDSLNGNIYDKYPKLNGTMAEKFDTDYSKYLSKNLNKSDKTAERMKFIEKHLSKFYTEPETSSKAPSDYPSASERYAYLGMNPDLIPKELKKYYKGVFK